MDGLVEFNLMPEHILNVVHRTIDVLLEPDEAEVTLVLVFEGGQYRVFTEDAPELEDQDGEEIEEHAGDLVKSQKGRKVSQNCGKT